jgi:hypothetical protein
VPTEQPLNGGQLTAVVRVGDTVRRPVGPWSPAVHALLLYLEDRGFTGAPRFLGVDEAGREILSFLPGKTVSPDQPSPWVWEDDILARTGAWLRTYHECIAGFEPPANPHWRMSWGPVQPGQIICHFDVAPYNLVVMGSGDVAYFDWDVAAPGSAMLELGKVANSYSPVHDANTCSLLGHAAGQLNAAMLERSIERLRVLLDAYGLEHRTGFVDWMIRAAEHSDYRIRRGAAEGDRALARLIDSRVIDHLLVTRDTLIRHHAELTRGLL